MVQKVRAVLKSPKSALEIRGYLKPPLPPWRRTEGDIRLGLQFLGQCD